MINLTEIYQMMIEENEILTNKHTIYQDMDGCLTDFEGSFKELSGGLSPDEYRNEYGVTEFWDKVDEGGVGFWKDMPWMEDGKQLWDYVKKYKPIVLSAPSQEYTSRLGKQEWMDKQLPGVELVLSSANTKKNYSKENAILIDDRKKTIDQWETGGGIGILHTSTSNTISQLKKLGL